MKKYTLEEKLAINVKCAQLLGLKIEFVNINYISAGGLIFDIFDGYSSLMPTADKLEIDSCKSTDGNISWMSDNILSKDNGSVTTWDADRRLSILKCVIKIVGES
tara:strand:- start:70809 stop:71123 length:315 start_codon:yes stop_codon:yes gene_type:complete